MSKERNKKKEGKKKPSDDSERTEGSKEGQEGSYEV